MKLTETDYCSNYNAKRSNWGKRGSNCFLKQVAAALDEDQQERVNELVNLYQEQFSEVLGSINEIEYDMM